MVGGGQIMNLKLWLNKRYEKKQCTPCYWYDAVVELCGFHIDYIEKNCAVRSIEFKEAGSK